MQLHRHLPTYFALLFLMSAAFADVPETKKDPNKQDTNKEKKDKAPNYYPLEVGNEWHYRTTANGVDTNFVSRIAKMETIDGVKLARLESPSVLLTEHLSQTAKGVFRHRFNGMEITPPLKLLSYPATPGAKWEGEFVVQNQKNKYTSEIHKDEEEVEVPAGKFKTIRMTMKIEAIKMETTYWFAKDVGFVKQTVEMPNLSVVVELEKFERKK